MNVCICIYIYTQVHLKEVFLSLISESEMQLLYRFYILNRNVRLLKSMFISMHSILGWASFCMNYCINVAGVAWRQSACGTAQV